VCHDVSFSFFQSSHAMETFDIKIERSKPCILEEIVDLLKRFLDYCLWCITCGCYHRQSDSKSFSGNGYEMILLDSEKKAVQNLLHYMELGLYKLFLRPHR
jgi:hypothetical protein